MSSIGRKLRFLLDENNIKHSAFAESLQLSPSRLSNYLNDKREPDLEILTRAAKYLNVDLNYFTDTQFNVNNKHSYNDSNDNHMLSMHDNMYVPIVNINARKKATAKKYLSLNKAFFKLDTTSVIFFINIVNSFFEKSSYVLARKIQEKTKIKNGNFILIPGRDLKLYQYIENGDLKVLMFKEQVLPIDADIYSGFRVDWVFNPLDGSKK